MESQYPRYDPPGLPEQEAVVCKLLVVDDDEMVRRCVSACLIAVGHEVVEAGDGLEAMAIYRTMVENPPIVIMDIEMPKLDGIEVAKRMREINPFTKVILMSGYSDRPIDQASPDAFLLKPFRGADLFHAIQQIMTHEDHQSAHTKPLNPRFAHLSEA